MPCCVKVPNPLQLTPSHSLHPSLSCLPFPPSHLHLYLYLHFNSFSFLPFPSPYFILVSFNILSALTALTPFPTLSSSAFHIPSFVSHCLTSSPPQLPALLSIPYPFFFFPPFSLPLVPSLAIDNRWEDRSGHRDSRWTPRRLNTHIINFSAVVLDRSGATFCSGDLRLSPDFSPQRSFSFHTNVIGFVRTKVYYGVSPASKTMTNVNVSFTVRWMNFGAAYGRTRGNLKVKQNTVLG